MDRIEPCGSGSRRMTAVCRGAGLAQPSFEAPATRFRVALSAARTGPPMHHQTGQGFLRLPGNRQGLAASVS